MSYDYYRPYIGYPPPPMPDIAFEPIPIMPPMYPGGIIPDPVDVVDAPPIDWVPATRQTAYSLMDRAFVAGKEGWDNSPLWAIRVHYQDSLIPGKLAVTHGAAYIPMAGREVPVDEFEVLCTNPSLVEWVSTSLDTIPENAIPAGNTHVGEPLYIGRVRHRGSLTPGKVHPSHRCCYISFSRSEISYKRYDILCEVQ